MTKMHNFWLKILDIQSIQPYLPIITGKICILLNVKIVEVNILQRNLELVIVRFLTKLVIPYMFSAIYALAQERGNTDFWNHLR